MNELEEKLRGAVEPLLEPGEKLDSLCVARFFERAER
jgi:hypothetical protein